MAIRVRATARGFGYDHAPKEVGEEFSIESEKQFSPRWMERISPAPKEDVKPDRKKN